MLQHGHVQHLPLGDGRVHALHLIGVVSRRVAKVVGLGQQLLADQVGGEAAGGADSVLGQLFAADAGHDAPLPVPAEAEPAEKAEVGGAVLLIGAVGIKRLRATGVGLGAVLFGPTPMAVIGFIILLFQSLLLAHGGLTTIGANVFSMAVVGPFAAYGVFKGALKAGISSSIAVFLAAFAGDILTYVATSIQLALAYPDAVGGFITSLWKFMGIFALTQIPLAVSEGLLSVIVYNVLLKYSYKELNLLKAV